MKVVTAEQMQAIDNVAIKKHHIPRARLMENAGKGVSSIMLRQFPKKKYKHILVVSGKGNNAGDGFVAARYLARHGYQVSVCLLSKEFKEETADNLKKLQKLDMSIFFYKKGLFSRILKTADVVVDALFGTGLRSTIRGDFLAVIKQINRADVAVVSVDIPSGIHGSSGKVMGDTVNADVTVTFGLPKIGCVTGEGIDATGELVVVNIGFPSALLSKVKSNLSLLLVSQFRHAIPKKKHSAHKGTGGHVLIVAGSPGKTGAAVLATQSAFRSGTGLVTLLTHPKSLKVVGTRVSEAFLELFPKSGKALRYFLEKKGSIAIGPGIGFSKQSSDLVKGVIRESRVPVVIDADGLVIVAKHKSWLKQKKTSVILTPHPGEMAKLVDKSTSFVLKHRISVAQSFAKKHGVIVVLKGARTLIAQPDGSVAVNTTGNSVLATAGTGDVLTGLIASLISQGVDVKKAATLGVFLHGLAADRWSKRNNLKQGMMASDLIAELMNQFAELTSLFKRT